jgi:magnesium transporter
VDEAIWSIQFTRFEKRIVMANRQKIWENIVVQIRSALENEDFKEAIETFLEPVPGDQVEVFNLLEDEEQSTLLEHLNIEATADLFDRLEDSETLEAAEGLPIDRLADILEEMQPDEAADLLGDLPPEQASLALEEMEDIEDVLPLLEFPDQTAGGRMTTAYISVRRQTTSGMTIEFLRHVQPDDEVPYYIFVTDMDNCLVGVVGLRELVVADPEITIEKIMDSEVIYVNQNMDQEIVAQVMTRYDLSALPVVNDQQRLVGVITHDDILDVLAEEATEDVYRLASVGDTELEPESNIREHLKGRLPWLYVNTITAMFAAWVISNFEGIIAQVAVLAVFQSVVAGLGGNASTQTIALIIRAIAIGKLAPNRLFHVLGREFLVAILQGFSVALVVGLGVYFWRGNIYLAIVLGAAIIGNLIVAGIVGTLIPLGLKALKQDPAMASPVLVTACTDSLGFLIFLSLATYFLTKLQ